MHSTRHLTHQAQSFTEAGNGWTSIGLQRDNFQVFIIQIYLRTGETLQSTGNSLILSHLLAYLHHLKAPFIVGGDWQNDAEALAATVIQSKFKAAIMDTGGSTTLQGSQLDYLLVSNSLVGSLALEAALCFRGIFRLQSTCLGGATVAEVSTYWQDLSTSTSLYQFPGSGRALLSWLGLGKVGHTNGAVHHTAAAQAERLQHLSPSSSLSSSVNVVHHTGHKRVVRDLSHMMVDVHRYGSDDLQADLFLAILQQWLQSPAKDPAELKAIVLDQEQKAQKQALYSTSLEFQEWLNKAHQKGLGGLFRSLRLRDQAWQRPFPSLVAPERIRAREQQWGEIWVPLQAPVQIRGLEHLRVSAQQEAAT